jgi:hypothetical protein
MGPRVRVRYRDMAFDEVDDALLSLALIDAFPTVLFMNGGRPNEKPEIDSKTSIPDCISPAIDIFVPERGWEPKYQRNSRYKNWFDLLNPPKHVAYYVRSTWQNNFVDPENPKWAFRWPTLEYGRISSNIRNDDLEDKAFVSALWKIITKLSTGRYCAGYFDWKTPLKETSRKPFLVGNHALAWCLEGDRRMVMGYAHPCTDWKPPETPWHRDLNRRFEAWRQRWPGGVVPKLPSDQSDVYAQRDLEGHST